jgi:glycine betaine catabolism B
MPPVAIRTLTPQVAGCTTIRLDSTLHFKPGQSVSIVFPGESKKRYYSLSSSPTEAGFIEITVKVDAEHPLAPIISTLKRGNTLEVDGPISSGLALPDPLDTPLCFIAAGTGVTPFRSMSKFLIDQSSPVEVWLLHSVKTQKDLLFHDDFSEWSGGAKWFHYVPTITQDFDDNWKNETGRINDTLLLKHIPSQAVTYLLCGPTAFVNDMEALLKGTLAVPPERIKREKW